MQSEYFINIEYASIGRGGEHLIAKYDDKQTRSSIFDKIVEKFEGNIISNEYLRKHGGIIISTAELSHVRNSKALAPFERELYLGIESLEELLKLVEDAL